MATERRRVFITGGTGYIGQRLIPRLLQRGHEVRALVRPGSEKKLPPGCDAVAGNALDASSYTPQVAPSDTFVQLVGVAHPSPAKADEFRRIDLPAGLGAVAAAKTAGVRHFVYVSVAHPAPMMQAYISVRRESEAAIEAAGLNATVLRPWYVLGAGTPVAISVASTLQGRRVGACNTGRRAEARACDPGTDADCTNVCGGEPCHRNPRHGRARNANCNQLKTRVNAGVAASLVRKDQSNQRITKAHARGTSTSPVLPMRCLIEPKWPSKTWTIFISESRA